MRNINITYICCDDDLNEQLEKIDIPSRGMWKSSKDFSWGYRKHYRGNWHIVEGRSPWAISHHIYKKFINKNINDAFSYFCSITPYYMQEYFWRYISKNIGESSRYRNWYGDNNYYIDEYNNIQKMKGIKPILSPVYVGKRTVIKKEIKYFHKPKKGFARRLAPIIEEKEEIAFTKKYYPGEKGYKRYFLERRKHKHYKEEEKEYDFNRLKRLKKANELDNLIRDRHGFDENSFRGIEYHGGKRKRDKVGGDNKIE